MAELLVAQQYARGLVRLLKEYASKLEELATERERRRRLNAYSTWSDVDQRIESMRPALLNVTREASQLAEQGDVRHLDRLELRLRLAEVEGLLHLFEKH